MRVAPLAAALAGAVLLTAAIAAAKDPKGGPITGSARVVDGDTIEIGGTRIRLAGMDAPENGQTCRDDRARSYFCGNAAGEVLGRLTAGQTVTCRPEGTDRYRRTLATCATPRVADLGLEMIRLGWATVYDGARAPAGYRGAEDAAQRRRLGLWRGSFERPSVWRRNSLLGGGAPNA